MLTIKKRKGERENKSAPLLPPFLGSLRCFLEEQRALANGDAGERAGSISVGTGRGGRHGRARPDTARPGRGGCSTARHCPARRGPARPRCERRPFPHPTRVNRSRAGQPLRHGRRLRRVGGGRGPPMPRGAPSPLFVHPCPSLPQCPGDRCQAGLPGPGKLWGFAGDGGRALPAWQGGVLVCGRREGAAPRATPAAPGVGAAFTSGGTPLFSDPGGSKQPSRGRERGKKKKKQT